MNLENRHFRRKTITQIKVSIGSFVTNDSDILKECSSLYSMLYTSKNTAATSFSGSLFFRQEYLQHNEINEQKCEGLMTEKECLEASKSTDFGKSPGMDGLSVEVYKVFWGDVSLLFVSCLKKSCQKGKLAIMQRRGILSLIPKKDP